MIGVGKRKRRRRAENHQKLFFTAALDGGCLSNAMDSHRAEVLGKANYIRGRPMPNDEDACRQGHGGSQGGSAPTFQRFRGGGVNSTANTPYHTALPVHAVLHFLHASATSTVSLPVFRHTLNPPIIFRAH